MSALKSSSSHGVTTPLCPPHPNPLSSRPSHPPFDISRPPSALSALVVYNMAISCLWQMKDCLHATNLSLESRAVEV
ncbi:hypothetical protein CesoFtcFv8_019711 [Champsocephalus esox]|uniref:Uncharacterized protein n=1 Tax=Champsocephalus esox TaxID=159716 RepID=A0AAN8GNG6_9TELE|nr:hypothetical protein CesoFtcFv8_019711 [Champsocephalus esox]